jgi:TetR/AcrR family transcriptional regulator, transcriptional repressor of bet genes
VPVIVDHAQRRAEIVEAAWHALADLGSEGATMRTIAERAGCSTGRLTHYFKNRDEILVAALRAVHTSAGKRMREAVARADGLDALRGVIHEALPLESVSQREWNVWIAFWGLAAAKPSLRREQRTRYAEWRQLIRTLIERSVEAGDLPPLDARAETDHLVALVDGLGLQSIAGGTSPPAAAIEHTIERHLTTLAQSRQP